MMQKTLSHPARGPGRPREFDMEQALDKAIVTFRTKGYVATSIGDLSQAMGLSAGSLYKAFTDKRDLFMAAFERYTSLRNAGLRARIDAAATGRERLRAVLQFYVQSSHGLEGRRGCLVVGSAVGLDTFDRDLAGLVSQALGRNEDLLIDLIEQGKADGSISPVIDGKAAAGLMLCILLGMRVVGKTGRSLDEMTGLADLALNILR
ncbi:TetR/AcrR family transcriptional regulator [Sodalis sp. RH21]|uniref:TetR/AcrR family transcriptional regulator n=1 Tax=unclassified Sodalis (in: enterobacteria) TaxID=2636512 RepID=UPI0039B5ADEA